jgi:hypothetical protein
MIIMNDGLVGMWEESVVVKFLERTDKNVEEPWNSRFAAEIQIG